MKLECLYYIVEVNQCKSISKAAKNLYITQPTLSVALSNLEDELGYPIFTRSRSGVTPTQQGEILIEAASEIIMKINDLQELTERLNEYQKIKIYAVPEICNSFLIDLIELINHQKHDITLELRESRNNKLLDHLINRDSNIGIGCYTQSTKERTLKKLKENQLEFIPILSDHFMVYLSKKDELSYQDYIYSRDLESKKAIMFDDSELLVIDSNKEIKITNKSYFFNDKSSIKKAVARNLGYAVLPGVMAIDDIYIETDQIRVKTLADSNVTLTTILIYDKVKLNKKERQIIQLIKQLASTMQEKINRLQTIPFDEKEDFGAKIYY